MKISNKEIKDYVTKNIKDYFDYCRKNKLDPQKFNSEKSFYKLK